MANLNVLDGAAASKYLKGSGAGTDVDPFLPEHYAGRGAANLATGQVTAGAAATLLIARPTRRRATVLNTDGTNAVYIGPATVTAGNGMKLAPGASITVTWVGLLQVVAAAGAPVVAYVDEWDA